VISRKTRDRGPELLHGRHLSAVIYPMLGCAVFVPHTKVHLSRYTIGFASVPRKGLISAVLATGKATSRQPTPRIDEVILASVFGLEQKQRVFLLLRNDSENVLF